MPVVTLVSAKGSPGVTTAAAAVAAAAVDGSGLLVELDPAGGDVRILTGVADEGGLVDAAGELRREVSSDAISRHAPVVVPGLRALLAPTAGLMATSVIGSVLDRWSAALHAQGGTVVVDGGRWDSGQPTARRAGVGDLVAIVCRPTVAGVEHARQTLDRLREVARRPVVAVVVGNRPYAPAEVAAHLDVPLAGAIAWDPRGAAVLWSKGVTRSWGRTWLAASAARTVEALVRLVPDDELPAAPAAAASPDVGRVTGPATVPATGGPLPAPPPPPAPPVPPPPPPAPAGGTPAAGSRPPAPGAPPVPPPGPPKASAGAGAAEGGEPARPDREPPTGRSPAGRSQAASGPLPGPTADPGTGADAAVSRVTPGGGRSPAPDVVVVTLPPEGGESCLTGDVEVVVTFPPDGGGDSAAGGVVESVRVLVPPTDREHPQDAAADGRPEPSPARPETRQLPGARAEPGARQGREPVGGAEARRAPQGREPVGGAEARQGREPVASSDFEAFRAERERERQLAASEAEVPRARPQRAPSRPRHEGEPGAGGGLHVAGERPGSSPARWSTAAVLAALRWPGHDGPYGDDPYGGDEVDR